MIQKIDAIEGAPPHRPQLSAFTGTRPEDLLNQFLAEQPSLTAVERFSNRQDAGLSRPAQERYYRDLLPLHAPGPGEQFAFEVDLDRCSGCKACVTACHSLNGLEEEETWRHVGLLHDPGGRRMQQTVTTACHHCAEPSCAQGCPTLAYEKDPETGVVRHLDDQCFGCQYCILKCPYDVPQYSKAKGIVRKCDLCVGRLRAGEAPACVQACPTQAIRVVLVDIAALKADPHSGLDLPGAPDPEYTVPATRYVSQREIPKSLQPVDAHQIRPEPAHLPLVFMLVASQTAIGFWVVHALAATAGFSRPTDFPRVEWMGLIAVFASLALGPLHLGRPWLAWKAFLNWRRSWLSREIIAFNTLGGTASLALAAAYFHVHATLAIGLTALAALASLHASAMVYRDTPRRLWATRQTLWRFALTSALCGGALYLVVGAMTHPSARLLAASLPVFQLAKLGLESRVLRHRDDEDPNAMWKAAQLLTQGLGTFWRTRVALGLMGGIALPAALTADLGPGWLASASLALLLAGELMERTLFFTTAIAPRMPGSR